MEANYSQRCDNFGGWGGLGYGCKQGAMHYQGIVAYYYDQIAPFTGVELDTCHWNQIAHSTIMIEWTKERNMLDFVASLPSMAVPKKPIH